MQPGRLGVIRQIIAAKPIQSSNAYYAVEVAGLVRASPDEVIGALLTNSSFSVDAAQRDVWLSEITVLQSALIGIAGTVFLEFVVPRIGSRLDAVLISGPAIFAIEFKVGESEYRRTDVNQVWDYALDLKNFHKGSRDAPIFPILVATEASSSDTALPVPYADGVYPPSRCNAEGLAHLIQAGLAHTTGRPLDAIAWDKSPYQPTPTIIEAAQALYSRRGWMPCVRSFRAGTRMSPLSSRTASTRPVMHSIRLRGERMS